MLRDVLILCSCASVAYAWLCAVVAPVVRAVRSVISRGASPLELPDTRSPAPLRRRAPLAWLTRYAHSLRFKQESRHAWGALALAVGGMLLWLVIVALAVVLGMMLEPRAGLALLRSHLFWPGLAFGTVVWGSQLALTHRMPRVGDAFEAATALAIVAVVNDDPDTLARVHQMYAKHAG